MKKEKRVRIQPEMQKDGTLPYPYFIFADGKIGRQDFWRGHPEELVGFNPKPKTGVMDGTITFESFWKDPKRCLGMYPIFSNKEGEYSTFLAKIVSIEEL